MIIKIAPPNERQKLFFKADTRFIAYGGARGGGKSWALRNKAILLAVEYPGIKILILRRTFPELRENHILPLTTALNKVTSYNDTQKTILFPNGSRIRFGYCDGDRDVLQYQGQEMDIIMVDEATQISEFVFSTLTACLRGTNNFPKRMYLSCNPGGIGHYWVKRLFIDRDYKNSEDPNDYTFIPARVYDNTVLMERDPNYVKMLENQPEDIRRAWLLGDWNIHMGQYFPEFRHEKHVTEPFPIPDHWRKYVSLDYGLDMLAVLWAAFDESGHVYIYREIYEPNLIVSEAAKRIKEHLAKEKVYAVLAPKDLWGRSADTGQSLAEGFEKAGVKLTPVGVNGRIEGWLSVKEWLAPDEEGTPGLKIFSTCRNLIRCLPLLQHDEHDPNDCAIYPHEITHAPDALRYMIAGRPHAAKIVKDPVYNFKSERPKKSAAGRGERVKAI